MRPKKARAFVPGNPFQPRLILVSKGKAYPSVAAYFRQRRKRKRIIKLTPVLSPDERAVRLLRGRR